jgi:sodium/potassium-transporting ATPase subunit alpha
MHRGDYKRNE